MKTGFIVSLGERGCVVWGKRDRFSKIEGKPDFLHSTSPNLAERRGGALKERVEKQVRPTFKTQCKGERLRTKKMEGLRSWCTNLAEKLRDWDNG